MATSPGKIQVSTDELTIGMYVSELDRPWIETPFLFQGFTITTQDEVAQLRQYCHQVTVDTTRSLADAINRGQSGTHSAWFGVRWVRRFFRIRRQVAKAIKRDRYTDTVSLQKELPAAQAVHDTATTVVDGVMQSLRSGGALETHKLREVVGPMIDSVLRNEQALAWLTRLRSKDNIAYQQSVATAVYALVFGKHLGLDRDALEVLAMGSLLLDVGLTRIPREILDKTGPLTPEELVIVRSHVELGVQILHDCGGLDDRVIDMVRTHHERFNGSGYPAGLSNGDIPVFGRIAGIVDTFRGMTMPRTYAATVSPCEAMMNLNHVADLEFQAELVEQFVQAIGCFPTGTLVELNSGEVGVVIAQNRVRRLRPKVLIVLDACKERLNNFREIDLRKACSNAHMENSVWISRGLEPGAYGIDPAEFYL